MSASRTTVLVTGCSEGGLGSALAVAFHNDGYRVLATARNISKMVHLEKLSIETLPLDVQNDESIKACVSKVSTLTDGKLDMLVNNAGGGIHTSLLDANLDRAREHFDLNVWSMLAVVQAFSPLLIAAKGRIVNNTSVCAVMNGPFTGIYNASKAAAAMLTDQLRLELAPFGVRAIDLRTGRVASNFHANRSESDNELPASSVYNVAKAEIEKYLSNAGVTEEDATPQVPWASSVVAALRNDKAPSQIWKGKFSFMSWLGGCFLPSTWKDVFFTRFGHLDLVKQRVQQA
ncbi:MAG: hypothetical protein M1828_003045 [Chrysothrix sp. TS-e1954]|nr:MAG: hypothetical protein M1828_003045 [Chrysothrix sp. TS-e1954]